jgi:hypothetical protein
MPRLKNVIAFGRGVQIAHETVNPDGISEVDRRVSGARSYPVFRLRLGNGYAARGAATKGGGWRGR